MSSFNRGREGRSSRAGRGGRGQYYKNKYGSGGRGHNKSSNNLGESNKKYKQGFDQDDGKKIAEGGTFVELVSLLHSLDNTSYPAYKSIESREKGWKLIDSKCEFSIFIGRTQSDPYAPPTRCRVVVPTSVASFPITLFENKIRSVALADFIHRKFYAQCIRMGADQSANSRSGGSKGGWSGPKGGNIAIEPPSQHVIEQSAVWIEPSKGHVTAQFTVNLPARGRTILGRKAVEIFERIIPSFVRESLIFDEADFGDLEHHVYSIEDQNWLRKELKKRDLIAFVRNGALLPRSSGANDTPMNHSGNNEKIILFKSPETLEVHFELPNLKQNISGMGFRCGINLIVGGGFHGKSTLLSAIQYGVYDKIPGDGREFCVCDASAVKIRAEDGRAVTSVDISPFISNLPFGKDTKNFTSADASGSTSQASNIIEAMEVGSKLLILDEDTCATNFMIRDSKMMELVSQNQEPITPFIQKVESLFKDFGVSSILVIGGSGDYFDVATTVVMMDCYECFDVTDKAKMICESTKSNSNDSTLSIPFGSFSDRFPQGRVFHETNKVSIRSKSLITYGETELDLRHLEQIVTYSQTNTISFALRLISSISPSTNNKKKGKNMKEVVEGIMNLIHGDHSLDDALTPHTFHGGLAYVRPLEIAFAMNRLRRDGSIIQ